MQGKKHYSEKLFKQFQLSDRVPTDNFHRRLKEMLEMEWLYKATKNYYGTEGQQSIDPVVFFKLMLMVTYDNQKYVIEDSVTVVPATCRLRPW